MSCECSINNTVFLYDLLNTNLNKLVFNYDLEEYIGDYSPQTSGIWLPVFFGEPPSGMDGKNWTRVTKGIILENPTSPCTNVSTPNGLGLADFITLDNPDLKSWNIVGNCKLKIDWIINFQTCKNYYGCILFWYRYYDIERENDKRLIPGVDIYISDGDYAFIENSPEVTSNLTTIANRIYQELLNSGYTDTDAKLKAKILASGPQIDKITDSLYYDPNKFYTRDGYGRIIGILSNMSTKSYGDIGKNNFIVTKYDLLKKLIEKYGSLLEVPENSKVKLISKFWSETGPNLRIGIDGDLYRSDAERYSGYNITVAAGPISVSAKKSSENFTPSKFNSTSQEILYTNVHSINYFKLNNKIIGYNLVDNVKGIFNPDLAAISFHGHGGVSFETTSKFGSSCADGITITAGDGDEPYVAKYDNTVVMTGPYFDRNLFDNSSTTIEKTRCQIVIDIETAINSKFMFNDQITTTYYRSESKPDCPVFPAQNTCNCYNLNRLHPLAKDRDTTNTNDLIYTPDTSLFYLPSGSFYGGLSVSDATSYGVLLPYHPNPGTAFPKIHSKPFPIDKSCQLEANGCGSQSFNFYMPYPGKVILRYASTKGYFIINDGTSSAHSPLGSDGTIFTSTAGTLCIDKKLSTPTGVSVIIGVPADEPETDWEVIIEGIQHNYVQQIPFGDGLVLPGKKGFFHPNFGWTNNPAYYNKSPVVPNYRNIVQKKLKNARESFVMTVSNGDVNCSFGPGPTGGDDVFEIYINNKYLGLVNINNNDTKYSFIIPSSIELINGNQIDIYIKCTNQYECNDLGAFIDIRSSSDRRTILYQGCVGAGYVTRIILDFLNLTTYNYNAYAMYNDDYLPGYNYIFNMSNIKDEIKNIFIKSDYLGIKTPSNSFYVTKDYKKIKYIPSESLILESVPFHYVNFDALNSYAINDFKYKKLSSNNIIVNSEVEGSGRALAYIDHPSYEDNQQFTIYSNKTLNNTVINVNNNNKNILTTTQVVSSPEFDDGFIFRSKNNQSIVVYRPNYTINDNITVGKWGNHSYSDAIYEFYKYLASDLELNTTNLNHIYNNSFLREKYSANTSFSWGAPIVFYNNYSANNITRYFPVSRLYNTYQNNQRQMHVVGFQNTYNSAVPDGDRIIASGTLSESRDYIYIGPYIGDLEIKVKVLPLIMNNTLGSIKLLHNNIPLDQKELSNNIDGIFTFNITKDNELSTYAEIIIDFVGGQCVGSTTLLSLKLQSYSVKINNTSEQLRQKSRISYYAHRHKPLLNTKPSFAQHFYTQAIETITNQKVAPLYENNATIEDKRIDYAPYLDLHIFSENIADMPIKEPSGVLFFQDFLQPKTNQYLQNMETPYNENFYWIDIPSNAHWSILTSKGILLEQNKIYKILKNLQYNCKGDAQKCSQRYPSDICDFSYSLTKEELFDLLGLSEDDKQFIDIKTIQFPSYCGSIDYCCNRIYDPTEYKSCLEKETNARKECSEYWTKTVKKDITCISEPCPDGNISGTITSQAEYFILSIKNNINPNLNNLYQSDFHFFIGDDIVSLPCTTNTFPSVGAPFKYNYSCSQLDSQCDSIVEKDFGVSSKYLPGELLDLSPLVRNQQSILNAPPSSVIFDNEIKYRSIFDHPNKITLPLEELDPLANSKYLISYTFYIKSKKCTNGQLFNIKIDADIDCTFWAQPTSSGTILISNCFQDTKLKDISCAQNSMKITKTICNEKHTCPFPANCADENCYYPSWCEHEDWSCSDAEAYVKSIHGEKAIVFSCEQTNSVEDYILDCRLCDKTLVNEDGEPCTINSWGYGLTYKTPLEAQCFCPEGSTLNNNICEYEYTVLECSDVNTKGTETTQKGSIPASCAPAGYVPSQFDIDQYNKACGIENVRTSKEYAVAWTLEAPSILKQHTLYLNYQKEWNRLNVAMYKYGLTYNDCATACFKEFAKCLEEQPASVCEKAESACRCSCNKDYRESVANIEAGRTLFYYCTDNCGWSDNIIHRFHEGVIDNCSAWYWWYGINIGTCDWSPLYYKPSSSYDGYNFLEGKYIKDCDYQACANVKERVIPKQRYISDTKCNCVKDYYGWSYLECNGECKDTVSSDLGQDTTSYKSHIVEYDVVVKTKRPPVTSFKDRESKYSNVKFYNKEFEIKWGYESKYKEVICDPPCKNNENCCPIESKVCSGEYDGKDIPGECIADEDCCRDKVDLDFNVTFDIYDNLIVGTLSSNPNNKLCKPRISTGIFKCPVISYKILNNDIQICDTADADCHSCYLGAFPT